MTEIKIISIHGAATKEQIEKIKKVFPDCAVVADDNCATSIRAINVTSDSVLVLKGNFDTEIHHHIAAVFHARGVYPLVAIVPNGSDIEAMDADAMKRHGWQRISQ